MEVVLKYGFTSIGLKVDSANWLTVRQRAEPQAATDPAALIRSALESPTRFPPLRRALTPDDRVALVLDETVPELERLVPPIVEHLATAGIRPGQITAVFRPNADRPDLECAWPGVACEQHDPNDRKQLGYLATTKGGRRLYINRTVVEADQIIVLAEVRFDEPAARMLYPAMTDRATIDALAGESPEVIEVEMKEVCWLLGLPFFVQVIASHADSVGRIVTGPADSCMEAEQQLNVLWQVEIEREAELAVVALTGDSVTHSTADLGRALANACNVVRQGGTIVLMSEAAPEFGAGFLAMRESSSPAAALKKLKASPTSDFVAARQWLRSVRDHRVLIFGPWAEDQVEELFATSIQTVPELQRVIDSGGDCVYLADAHRSRATIAK